MLNRKARYTQVSALALNVHTSSQSRQIKKVKDGWRVFFFCCLHRLSFIRQQETGRQWRHCRLLATGFFPRALARSCRHRAGVPALRGRAKQGEELSQPELSMLGDWLGLSWSNTSAEDCWIMSECVSCCWERRRRAVRTNAIGKLKQRQKKNPDSLSGFSASGRKYTSSKVTVLGGKSTNQDSPDDGKGRELLEVEGEVEAEARFEEGSDGLWGANKSHDGLVERWKGQKKKRESGRRGHSDEETRLQTRPQCSGGSVRAVKNLSSNEREWVSEWVRSSDLVEEGPDQILPQNFAPRNYNKNTENYVYIKNISATSTEKYNMTNILWVVIWDFVRKV